MEIGDIQKKVVEFSKKREREKGFIHNEELSLIHLMEEVGEAAEQLFSKKARPDKFNQEKLKEEICDIILESMILAEILKIDLSKELNKKIEELNNRRL